MELFKELWFQNVIAILMLFIIPATLFIFPNFFIRISRNNIFQILFRLLLVIFLLWVQIFDYKNLVGNNPTDWKSYFYLEFCTIECWVVIILLIYPNKLLMDCALPMGLIGPVLTVFFGNLDNSAASNHLFSENWIHFFMGHIIFMSSYLYLYIYGFTNSRFNKTLIIRSVTYTAIVGLSVEVYNLAFDTNFIFEQVASLFIGTKDEIDYFLFVVILIFPALFAIFLPVIYFILKPIYDTKNKKERIDWTWFEKTKYYFKKKRINKKTEK